MVYAGYGIKKFYLEEQSNLTIVAVGAIISEIPFVDKIDTTKIKTGNAVKVENDTITIG